MSRPNSQEKLTAKQAAFVLEYLKDLNATQAAIRAGYSVKNAGRISTELVSKSHIVEAIKEQQQAMARRTLVTADRVIAELAKVAFASMRNYVTVNEDGTPVLDFNNNAADLGVVSEITQETYVEGKGEDARDVKRTRFKLYDKMNALSQLAKNLGITPETLNVQSSKKFEIRIIKGPGDDDA
ncbi:hypothetical protein JCM15519_17020 [Fundidesulfovibrio butyratiphilus]